MVSDPHSVCAFRTHGSLRSMPGGVSKIHRRARRRICATHRGVVKMEVSFLDAFAMVSLRVGQPEEALFQEVAGGEVSLRGRAERDLRCNLLFLVPKAEGNVLSAVRVTDTGDAILAPAESARSSMIVREIFEPASTSLLAPLA